MEKYENQNKVWYNITPAEYYFLININENLSKQSLFQNNQRAIISSFFECSNFSTYRVFQNYNKIWIKPPIY